MPVPKITAALALSLLASCDVAGLGSTGNTIDGLAVQIVDGSPSAARNTAFNTTRLLEMHFASTKVEIPFHVTYALTDTAEGQKVKAQGKTVRMVVRNTLKLTKRDIKSGDVTEFTRQLVIPDTSYDCAGYCVALAPENGYRIDLTFSRDVDIRSVTSGLDGWGAEHWELTSLVPAPEIYKSALRNFTVDSGRTHICALPGGNWALYNR